ncbi:MAG: hypothetical protein J0M13_10060 [Candidatus Accumulibacter sp.]|jgi:hypothetical protein|nr:hypothetical protein [Candidatus Accumulibacter necessarius]
MPVSGAWAFAGSSPNPSLQRGAARSSRAAPLSFHVSSSVTDTSIYSEIAKAVPVVIGGLLAIGGGLIGHFVTHHLTSEREQSTRRRERLESLVKALYAHSQWLDDKRNSMIFRNEDHDAPSPLYEARMLQGLHFPELAEEILAVQKAQLPILEFISEQRIARMKDQNAWISSWSNEPYNEAYELYLLAIQATTHKCRKLLSAQPKS